MATQEIELCDHPEWEITSSVTRSQMQLPQVNLYAFGPEPGAMPFVITMSLEQAQVMIEKLVGSCELLEAGLEAAASASKH